MIRKIGIIVFTAILTLGIYFSLSDKASAHSNNQEDLVILHDKSDEFPDIELDEKSERLTRSSEPEDRIEFVPDYGSNLIDGKHYQKAYYEERRVELIMGELYDIIYRTPVEFSGYNQTKIVDVEGHYKTVGYEKKLE